MTFFVDDLPPDTIIEMDTRKQWRLVDAGEPGVNTRVELTAVDGDETGQFSKDGLQRMYEAGALTVVDDE